MAGLSEIALPELKTLRAALRDSRISAPLSAAALQSIGLHAQADVLLGALSGWDRETLLGFLDLLISDREDRQSPELDLVWTGPEPAGATSRDTAIVVRHLFQEAQRSVIVGGYSFDHGTEILAPLHGAMKERGVQARFFVDIPGEAPTPEEAHAYATEQIDAFLAANWTFGDPVPEIYYDPRTVARHPYASLHAKCIVVDEQRALITSANFTARGQARNIEVGVLIEDRRFAVQLATHWNRLVSRGLIERYRG